MTGELWLEDIHVGQRARPLRSPPAGSNATIHTAAKY
jgi:hypothetical protein